jgi:hypothetical protein
VVERWTGKRKTRLMAGSFLLLFLFYRLDENWCASFIGLVFICLGDFLVDNLCWVENLTSVAS